MASNIMVATFLLYLISNYYILNKVGLHNIGEPNVFLRPTIYIQLNKFVCSYKIRFGRLNRSCSSENVSNI